MLVPVSSSNELMLSNAVVCAATLSLMIDAKLVTIDQATTRLRSVVENLPERLRTPGLIKQLQLVTSGLEAYRL